MSSLMHQGRATYAFFERNWNLTRRYWGWELVWLVYNIVNAMSVTYIGASAQLITGVKIDTSFLILYLLIGTSVWSYLSVTFDGVTDIINMERWEGTIEYTFMAPISRFTHMVGSCMYAVVHGLLFTVIQLSILPPRSQPCQLRDGHLHVARRQCLVYRLWHRDRRSTTALYRKRYADVVHRTRGHPAGIGCLLSRRSIAGLDATISTYFACDLRVRGIACGYTEKPGYLVSRDLELYLAITDNWYREHPIRHLHLWHRRALRQENRQVEEKRIIF